MAQDYGKTIYLPKTDFPRRAGLAKKEPELLERWNKMDIYNRQRKESAGKEKFILHMGPPFANGHIHMGHALSTILKDVVVRSYQMMGYDAPLVPGFDCHGLPIEWKIEEKYRAEGRDKEGNSPVQFREECRQFAKNWVGVQSGELARLGINGDWKNPYLTMTNEAEALISKELHKFLLNGNLYRGSKPVMWSVPEQTALAEAEVEYKDHTSDTVWVKFPLNKCDVEFEGAYVVIWTTTPWTLPANRAIAYGEDIDYVGIEIQSVLDESRAIIGDRLLVCKDLLESLLEKSGIEEHEVWWEGKGSYLDGFIAKHTLHAKGYDFEVPLLPADYVTTEAGTGFVHIAPSHGEDDYKLGLKFNLPVPYTVEGNGQYTDKVPLFAGEFVYTAEGKKGPANKLVMDAIEAEGNLLTKSYIKHSYPHSWRSKAPVIFRNTPQWFISMDENDLREKALTEIAKTRWVPAKGEKRIDSMVRDRGDWCISRQRSWGVPISVFVNKETNEVLKDEAVLNRIISVFMEEGSDAWFSHDPQDFLGDEYHAEEFEQITDIIDVWFESGSTHAFVLEQRPDLQSPADLYLEGSDQHRGWFQSSLLVSCGTRDVAPYKAVLTHGFILNEKGYKMSKSGGEVISPIKLTEQFGADIVRLWVAGSDYTEDIRIGKNVLQGHIDIYRRIRNTFCYLLGNLSDYTENNRVDYDDLTDLDRYVLHRLYEIDQTVKQCIKDYEFQKMVTVLHNFCTRDLSAFYFDICKDYLYCNSKDGSSRRGVQTVLDQVFNSLVHWLSPFLCYTTEEAWLSRKGLTFDNLEESVFLTEFPNIPSEWENKAIAENWETIRSVRRVVNGAIEVKRAEKVIRSSLEAAPKIYVQDAGLCDLLNSISFDDIVISSSVEILNENAPTDAFTLDDVQGVAVIVENTVGGKCERCWKYTDDVGKDNDHPEVCGRCAEVLKEDQLDSEAA